MALAELWLSLAGLRCTRGIWIADTKVLNVRFITPRLAWPWPLPLLSAAIWFRIMVSAVFFFWSVVWDWLAPRYFYSIKRKLFVVRALPKWPAWMLTQLVFCGKV